jgi:hypothetical protein
VADARHKAQEVRGSFISVGSAGIESGDAGVSLRLPHAYVLQNCSAVPLAIARDHAASAAAAFLRRYIYVYINVGAAHSLILTVEQGPLML